MLEYGFENFCDEMTVSFYLENSDDCYEIIRFRFSDQAFESVEEALDLWAGAVGNNFCIETAFGYMTVETDSYVYYEGVQGVYGYAEDENPGKFWDRKLHVKLFYPEEMGMDEIYRLINEDLDIKAFKPFEEQLFINY